MGIKKLEDALTLSKYAGLDLVLMNPGNTPAVGKIMDYNKYVYEKKKKLKEQQKHQRENTKELKEYRLSYNIDIGDWTRRQTETPNKPIEKITFVCMGHDPNLKAMFIEEMQKLGFKVDLDIVDILRDKKDLTFKRDSDARIKISGNNLSITDFYPMNLLQKLSIQCEDVSDWKELVDSVMIDWNYDGTTFSPSVTDIPAKNDMVKGVYEIPKDAGTIHIKITDLLSESWEGSFEA